jgi:hypothetical protein
LRKHRIVPRVRALSGMSTNVRLPPRRGPRIAVVSNRGSV